MPIKKQCSKIQQMVKRNLKLTKVKFTRMDLQKTEGALDVCILVHKFLLHTFCKQLIWWASWQYYAVTESESSHFISMEKMFSWSILPEAKQLNGRGRVKREDYYPVKSGVTSFQCYFVQDCCFIENICSRYPVHDLLLLGEMCCRVWLKRWIMINVGWWREVLKSSAHDHLYLCFCSFSSLLLYFD